MIPTLNTTLRILVICSSFMTSLSASDVQELEPMTSPRFVSHLSIYDGLSNNLPITSDQILEGLVTGCALARVPEDFINQQLDEIEGSLLTPEDSSCEGVTEKGLAHARSIASLKIRHLFRNPMDMFAIQHLQLSPYNRRPESIMVVQVLKDLRGHINFFHYDSARTSCSNYEHITQSVYEKGKTHMFGDPHIAYVGYKLEQLQPNTYMLDDEKGYQPAVLAEPVYQCYITSLYVEPEFRNKGIGSRLLKELAKLMFKSHSVNFISAMVIKDNLSSRRAFEKNYYKHVISGYDIEKPGIQDYIRWAYSGHMITLDGQILFTPVGEFHFNFYLPRSVWMKKLKNKVVTPRSNEQTTNPQ